MKETILVFVSHNDDQIIGAGATLAKYIEEGKEVIVVIFSYGESSRPLEKANIVVNKRMKEAEKVDEFLGIKETLFLGIPDLRIDTSKEDLLLKVEAIIKKYKPNKIFTHSQDDPHKDHRAVREIVLSAVGDNKIDVYTFSVWNPLRIIQTRIPKLYVDVSSTFNKKTEALRLFESQKLYVYLLLPNIYVKARIAGVENGCKYAEVFYKER